MGWKARIGSSITLLCLGSAIAGDVEVVETRFQQQANGWVVSTTLRHDDSGWEHYADAWRVVTETGEVLGTRTLFHPHEQEQPFTRSLSGLVIPKGVSLVFVEAHDKVHGWAKQRIRVDLGTASGERYSVQRR